VKIVLLHASSNFAALAVVRALRADDIEAGWDSQGDGTHAVWVWVPTQREPEALKIAATVDPSIRKPDALGDQGSTPTSRA
jgi:hypothetical protein